MKNIYCEKCDKMVNPKVETTEMIFEIKGEEIKINGERIYCDECGEELFVKDLINNNLKKAYKKYSIAHNLILPDEIKDIRNTYGLSQVLFSKILGLGEATIKRYESGSLVSPKNSEIIKSSSNPKIMRKMLEDNKENISLTEYNQIDIILQNINENIIENFREEEIKATHKNVNLSKVEALFAYFVEKINQTEKKDSYFTKILKLLWLTDKLYYIKNIKKMTNIKYAYIDHGPVPESREDILKYIKKKNIIELSEEEIPFDDGSTVIAQKLSPKDTTYKKYLTKKEEEIAEKIWNAFGDMSSKKLGDEVTHKFNEWKNTNIGDNTEFDTKGIEIFKEYF